MSWLSSWLHELILVVLMAAFVEMLLPSKSMERYARLVLSLLVLLTMLSPIISLLKGDASKELTVAMQQQERSGGLLSGTGGAPDSLDKILADGRMLAAGARDQSLKLAAEEIAGQMRDQIAGSTGLGGVKVTVALAMGPNPNAPLGEEVPLISSVTVALPPEQSASGGAVPGAGTSAHPSAGPIQINPVEPVQVSLEGSGGDGEAQEAASSGGSAPASSSSVSGTEGTQETLAEEAGTIIKLLEQNWNLDPALIKVQSSGAGTVKS
ncbi:sporulation stage III protein af [Paenibacillus sp. FSL R7-269]|uniref:stage III sporulation protein AF n=1 Tax=Paenibacillus sp. FSL R7-269 TaxID=1226755 RepID=UPI0003E1F523|nr:stage III sporulation protein AF [Paenibacillus sp. FSL R7-269]ETT44262.1 sporulation stage III protein af [Paenibacillus sp. FSL R7-269]